MHSFRLFRLGLAARVLAKTKCRCWDSAPFTAGYSTTSAGRGILQHEHLKPKDGDSLVRYDDAESLQEDYRAEFLAWKGLPEATRITQPCPKPKLLSFVSTPTYTLGRRQDALTADQHERLSRPLRINTSNQPLVPDIRQTNRGGLTTYHGPGQLVFWPIIDMHSPLYPRFGVASYASHLECTTRRLLFEQFGIKTYTNADEPGVWVETASGQERKIAALGVHHRRYVTALGIAININIPVTGDESVNPWARFVPCGLQGKLVTSAAAETGQEHQSQDFAMLTTQWANIFEQGLLDTEKRLY